MLLVKYKLRLKTLWHYRLQNTRENTTTTGVYIYFFLPTYTLFHAWADRIKIKNVVVVLKYWEYKKFIHTHKYAAAHVQQLFLAYPGN